jgi:hypothetical protein
MLDGLCEVLSSCLSHPDGKAMELENGKFLIKIFNQKLGQEHSFLFRYAERIPLLITRSLIT